MNLFRLHMQSIMSHEKKTKAYESLFEEQSLLTPTWEFVFFKEELLARVLSR